jgi:hypothetical protein
MLYKLLGFFVWRFVVGYVRLRLRGVSMGRRIAVGIGLFVLGAALAGARRRPASGQLTP